MDPKPFLIEASWEVCNKVGGIYTVISSKLAEAMADFDQHYLAVGPYLGANNSSTFKELPIPAGLEPVVAGLLEDGVTLHYGTWMEPGNPNCVLLDWSHLIPKLDEYKGRYWEQFGLDTLGTDFYDVDQPILWSTAVGLFVKHFSANRDGKTTVQLHEWLSSGTLLIISRLPNKQDIHTVFTTHATVLGRALSSEHVAIYNELHRINPDQEATRLRVVTKHQLEKLGAHLATRFTTVSQLTAEEATVFLDKKPDFVTENGLNTEELPTYDQIAVTRVGARQALDDFVSAYFFPSYAFDLSKVQYQFTMGRYEVHNKGYDLYLAALGRLNRELKDTKSDQTVVSFLLVPGNASRIRPGVTGQLLVYRRIQQYLQAHSREQQHVLYQDALEGHLEHSGPSLSPEEQGHFQELISRLVRPTQPFLSPFELNDEAHDSFTNLALQHELQNREEDRVKIVLLPVYFDGFDGLFNLPLYTLVSGCDLGVFPSFYEPWGYTPMESLAMGVPAITSTLAGFGRAIQDSYKTQPSGVFLVDRRNAEADAEDILLGHLHTSLRENAHHWVDRRLSAYQTVRSFTWKHLYSIYKRAYSA
jgi:glycogen(starch) synthase